MKMAMIVFLVMAGFMAIIMFGSIGASRFVRWMGWPQETLIAVGLIAIVVAGICISGWRFGVLDEKRPSIQIKP